MITAEPEPKDKKIGNYLIGKTIGQGTFGKVKLGTHTTTGQAVAIKILNKDKIVEVADVQRVSREIHILKLIRHPSIIQLYEIIETTRHLFLIMEYIQKGELFQTIVNQGKLNQQQACRYFKQLISGVAYLHKLNIVHRDLKPENLLIGWNDTIKIVDFGLSNTYDQDEMLKTACGSPCYAAPEMIANKKYRGLEVDIWSCGVILFAMVCGYLPFQDVSNSALYKKILSCDYTLPQTVSPQFSDLIQKILHTDPTKRSCIKQMYQHPWCNQISNVPLESGILVGYHRMPIDWQVLAKLKDYGLDVEYCSRCIEANKHNSFTTTYYLLLKREIKGGYQSWADIGGRDFYYAAVMPYRRGQSEAKQQFFGTQTKNTITQYDTIEPNIKQPIRSSMCLKTQPSESRDKARPGIGLRKGNYLLLNIEKKQHTIVKPGQQSRDLRMYLLPPERKQYFSVGRKRREEKKRIISISIEQKQSGKPSEENCIRLHTQASESKKLNRPKYTHLRPNTRIGKLGMIF